MRDNSERQYNKKWLQYDRPQPMYDHSINKFYDNFYNENPVHNHFLDEDFIKAFDSWISNHQYSKFYGFKKFTRKDIINGCTQFIDDLYQRKGKLQILKNDYKYHERLNSNIQYKTLETLDNESGDLLISMPFPYYGDIHPQMNEILEKCHNLNIPVHIDGAWISCIRDINFNFDHPAIQTVGISLSKGGMGGNRIGVRYSVHDINGPISIMNDYNMNSQALVSMGIKFIETFGPEYFWRTYENEYYTICKDFNLETTKAIHLAKKDNKPVGIRPLLRFLKKKNLNL